MKSPNTWNQARPKCMVGRVLNGLETDEGEDGSHGPEGTEGQSLPGTWQGWRARSGVSVVRSDQEDKRPGA